ncbi:alpha/beta fold hydrolase [Terriglobus albidus]|uniref:alpha/beta fold hydrolase n=1 Tax=Terriglobus albidus TaxID=1592106 RepID=UPI0021DFF897|nr:alpha/beta hydrolase [Terriglobus albidus]
MNLLEWMTSALPEPAAQPAQTEVSPGCTMRYLEAGAGYPVVLLHGLLGAADIWRRNLPTLAREYRVIAVDQLTCERHGWVNEQDADIATSAERLLQLFNRIGIERCHLIGHSYGGSVAVVFAAKYPERVASLVLLAPPTAAATSLLPLIRFWNSPLGRWFGHRVTELPRRLQELALLRMYGERGHADERTLDLYLRALRRPGAVMHILSIIQLWHHNMNAVDEALAALPEQRVLLLWGDRDRTAPVHLSERLRQRLPQAELQVITGAGHLIFEEAPHEANLLFADWLRRNTMTHRVTAHKSEVA